MISHLDFFFTRFASVAVMKIQIFKDKVSLGKAAAAILRAIAQKGSARIIAATGTSQFEFLDSPTKTPGVDWRQVEMFHLDERCRRQQVNEGWFGSLSAVPEKAISMSVRQILKSEAIICIVPDARKARVVKACFEGR